MTGPNGTPFQSSIRQTRIAPFCSQRTSLYPLGLEADLKPPSWNELIVSIKSEKLGLSYSRLVSQVLLYLGEERKI